MYNKRMIRFDFCDIQNNQGLGKCYHPRPYLDLIKNTPALQTKLRRPRTVAFSNSKWGREKYTKRLSIIDYTTLPEFVFKHYGSRERQFETKD